MAFVRRALTLAALALLAGGAACPPAPADAGPPDDAGPGDPPADGGAPDGGPEDAGPVPDDGGVPDPFADAGEPPEHLEYPFGTFGGPCEESEECDTGLCTSAFGDDFCTRACSDDEECDPGNGAVWSCRFVGTNRLCVPVCADERWCQDTAICAGQLPLPEGDTNLCLDFSQTLCTADGDCDLPEVCALVGAGFNLLAHCTSEAAGYLRGGEACDPDFQRNIPCSPTQACPGGYHCNNRGTCQLFQPLACAASVCWDQGTCAAVCAVNADCPEGDRCRRVLFDADRGTDDPTDDGYTFTNLCEPWTGSEAPCEADVDCPDGERCSYRNAPEGVLDLVCRAPDPGAVGAGERCGDDPRTVGVVEPVAVCDSNLCNAEGICVHLCREAADCGEGGWLCVGDLEAGFYGIESGICVPGRGCDTDGDCLAGEMCRFVLATEGLVGRCEVPEGAIAGGLPCDESAGLVPPTRCRVNADCEAVRAAWVCDTATYLCRPPDEQECELGFCPEEGYCPERCATDADCGHPNLACRGSELQVFDGFTGDVHDDLVDVLATCRYLPGSRSPCGHDADCPGEESCRLSFSPEGVLEQLCSSVRPEGAAVGEVCGGTGTSAIFCQSGLCDFDADGDGDPTTGVCSALCLAQNDCPEGMVCDDVEHGLAGEWMIRACRVE